MKKILTFLLIALLVVFSILQSTCAMEHKSLKGSTRKTNINKIGVFIEGFTEESKFRTILIVKSGFEGSEIVTLTLKDLKEKPLTDFQLLVTPSEGIPEAKDIIKEGMDILANAVMEGSFLFSQLDSTSPICKEFIYDGKSTVNSVFIYNGICRGPITNIGPMETESRVIVTSVSHDSKSSTFTRLFVHRGFYFEDAEKKEECRILVKGTPRNNSRDVIEFRGDQNAKALIVLCKYGKGAAIMSGLQLDQNSALIERIIAKNPDNDLLKKLKESLSPISDFASLLKYLLTQLLSI